MYKWTKMIDVPNDLPLYDRAQFQIGTDIYLIGGNGYFAGNWDIGVLYKYSYISNVPFSYQMMQRRNT